MIWKRPVSYVAVFYRTWFGMKRVKKFYYDEREWQRAMQHMPMSRSMSKRLSRVKRIFGIETRLIWG